MQSITVQPTPSLLVDRHTRVIVFFLSITAQLLPPPGDQKYVVRVRYLLRSRANALQQGRFVIICLVAVHGGESRHCLHQWHSHSISGIASIETSASHSSKLHGCSNHHHAAYPLPAAPNRAPLPLIFSTDERAGTVCIVEYTWTMPVLEFIDALRCPSRSM